MLEKPNLEDALIIDCLQAAFGFAVETLEFLPVGNDPTAWVYKVSTVSRPYFLKVKRGDVPPSTVHVPRGLYEAGIQQIVTPVPNHSGELWTPLAGFNLILYPYIDGRSGMEIGLSSEQWTKLGAILKRIHQTRLSPQIDTIVPRESFVPNSKWTAALLAIEPKLIQHAFNTPYEAELAIFWREHAAEIMRINERTHELGQLLKARSLPFVICHADIHTANILVKSSGQLYVVDWDGTIFAPKERDLMFIIGEKNHPSPHERAFLSGYGSADIDWQAMAYYRYEWVIQEIAEYGELIFLTANIGDVTAADALSGFKQLFDAGDVVEQAYKSENALS